MALNLEDIKKYEQAAMSNSEAARLVKTAQNKHSHCILLESEDCLVLDVLTFVYLKAVFSTKGPDFLQRLVSNSVPDIITLPQGDKVLSEDVEFIVETAYLTPSELDSKIYIIDKCETMNETSQNKLLKLLEEPPASSRFILKCISKFNLLPTVISRSEVVEIQPLPDSAVLAALPCDISPSLKNLIIATSFGRLDYVEKLIQDPNYLTIEQLAFEVLFDLKRSSDLARVSFNVHNYKEYIETLIFYIECVLHDCMVYSLGSHNRIYFKHREREIVALSRAYKDMVVLATQEPIMRARQRLKTYGNLTGIIDELLFSILEERTKWQKL